MEIDVRTDRDNNVATIVFSVVDHSSKGYEITDEDGETIAVLHVSSTGQVTRLQLLDAEHQLPGF